MFDEMPNGNGTVLFYTSCTHVLCINCLPDERKIYLIHRFTRQELTSLLGLPVTPQGQNPQVECPYCAQEDEVQQTVELYYIRGFARGQYHTNIPRDLFSIPPVSDYATDANGFSAARVSNLVPGTAFCNSIAELSVVPLPCLTPIHSEETSTVDCGYCNYRESGKHGRETRRRELHPLARGKGKRRSNWGTARPGPEAQCQDR